jgi:hypothetical protein
MDATTITSTNVSYTASFSVHSITYTNEALLTTKDVPFNIPAITSGSTATYKLVGPDSIHFESGSVFSDPVSTAIQSSGAKLDLQGNIFYMTQNINQTQTQIISGIPMTITTNVKAVAKFQKQ